MHFLKKKKNHPVVKKKNFSLTISETVRPILRIKFSKTVVFQTLPTTKKPAFLAIKPGSWALFASLYPFLWLRDLLKWAQNPSFRIMNHYFNVKSGWTISPKISKKIGLMANIRE